MCRCMCTQRERERERERERKLLKFCDKSVKIENVDMRHVVTYACIGSVVLNTH